MIIVADENIPLLDYYFAPYGQLILKPGRAISKEDLKSADILLVRTVTKINKQLLEHTPVKFVGSVMSGSDHIDIDWLNQTKIPFAVATGCNSTAVAEYVLCVIARLQKNGFLQGNKLRAGIIGVGRIGANVVAELKKLGMEILQYDPIRAEQEENFISTPLEKWVDLDLVSIHTPLTTEGSYPTYHMINRHFLQQQKKGCILLNTSRGSVIDFNDLKKYGKHLHWCLDVWEQEPNIDLEVLQDSLLATPHIAGHTIQSKYRGVTQIYFEALKRKILQDKAIPAYAYPRQSLLFTHKPTWQEFVLAAYDPQVTTNEMKKSLLHYANNFDYLRNHFPNRYEFDFIDTEIKV